MVFPFAMRLLPDASCNLYFAISTDLQTDTMNLQIKRDPYYFLSHYSYYA